MIMVIRVPSMLSALNTLPLYGSHEGTVLNVWDNARQDGHRKVRVVDLHKGMKHNVLGSAAVSCYSALGSGLEALAPNMSVRFFIPSTKMEGGSLISFKSLHQMQGH